MKKTLIKIQSILDCMPAHKNTVQVHACKHNSRSSRKIQLKNATSGFTSTYSDECKTKNKKIKKLQGFTKQLEIFF